MSAESRHSRSSGGTIDEWSDEDRSAAKGPSAPDGTHPGPRTPSGVGALSRAPPPDGVRPQPSQSSTSSRLRPPGSGAGGELSSDGYDDAWSTSSGSEITSEGGVDDEHGVVLREVGRRISSKRKRGPRRARTEAEGGRPRPRKHRAEKPEPRGEGDVHVDPVDSSGSAEDSSTILSTTGRVIEDGSEVSEGGVEEHGLVGRRVSSKRKRGPPGERPRGRPREPDGEGRTRGRGRVATEEPLLRARRLLTSLAAAGIDVGPEEEIRALTRVPGSPPGRKQGAYATPKKQHEKVVGKAGPPFLFGGGALGSLDEGFGKWPPPESAADRTTPAFSFGKGSRAGPEVRRGVDEDPFKGRWITPLKGMILVTRDRADHHVIKNPTDFHRIFEWRHHTFSTTMFYTQAGCVVSHTNM